MVDTAKYISSVEQQLPGTYISYFRIGTSIEMDD